MATWPESSLVKPHAAPEGRGKQEEKKKRKEEKWCLLSGWCCEDRKEGHGQLGALGVQQPGMAGAAEGRGWLPSHPVPAIGAFPGKRSRSLGMRDGNGITPSMLRERGPGSKAAVAAPAQRSCLVLSIPRDGAGNKNTAWECAVQAGRAARRHGSRKRHRGPAQCNK